MSRNHRMRPPGPQQKVTMSAYNQRAPSGGTTRRRRAFFYVRLLQAPPHQHTSVFSLVTSSISCCKRLLESPKFPFEVVGLPPGTSLQQQLPTVLYESGLYHWYYSPSRRLIASVNCRHFRPCNARARVGASARAPLINGGIK